MSKKSRIKKIFLFFTLILSISTTLILSACHKQRSLYECGIEITTLIGKMIKDENYLKYIGLESHATPEPQLSKLKKLSANDYDTPIRTYKITNPNQNKYRDYILGNKKETYNNLPNEYKEIIDNKLNMLIEGNGAIFTICHERYLHKEYEWDDYVVASSLSVIKKFQVKLKEPINYLYIFETGHPILVNFTPNDKNTITATGLFFMGDCSSLSAIREITKPFGCTVTNL